MGKVMPFRRRRKMKRVCCCLSFLLVLNLLLTVHISHNLCEIMQLFWENDIVLLPGGEQSFCNDFCVNLCINDAPDFQCEITDCLNNCNLHFGNEEMVGQPMDDELPPPPRPDFAPRGQEE